MNVNSDFHYIVPGLFEAVAAYSSALPVGSFPALEKFMARSSVSVSDKDVPRLLADLFDLPTSCLDVPVAALSSFNFLTEEEISDSYWIIASPVLLKPDRDRLVLHLAENCVDTQQINFFAKQVKTHFDSIFVDIKLSEAGHWYIRLSENPKITTTPLNQVVGRNIERFMPEGENFKAWHSVMNEIQMLLYSLDSVEYGFNALWFHGVGQLPKRTCNQKLTVLGNDALLTGLSQLNNCHVIDSLTEILNKEIQQPLVSVENSVIDALCIRSETDWMNAVKNVDLVLEQALNALAKNKITNIHLYDINGKIFKFSKNNLWKFWEKNQSISHYSDK